MKKLKNTIPVYDICSLSDPEHVFKDVIAQPFGPYLERHPNLYRPHRHSFYHIVFFTKGSGYHTIDFEKFEVCAGQIYFMIPGQAHSWNFEGEVDGFVVNFSDRMFLSLLNDKTYLEQYSFLSGVAKESVCLLSEKNAADAASIMARLVQQLSDRVEQMSDFVCANLILLFRLVQWSGAGNGMRNNLQPKQLILYNFRRLIEANYAEKRLPVDYAALLYITPNYLNALCKDLLAKSAGELIRDRILLEAKRLLINAEQPISEIAAQLNFSDNSHFTKFFKKHVGQTPEEFRKKTGVK